MEHRSQSSPERTCVGCRKHDSRDELLRFVVMGQPPQLVPDIRHRAPGRGASVHPTRACLGQAIKTGGFRRAFKRGDLQPTLESLAECAAAQYQRRAEGLLQAARSTGALIAGTDAVRLAMSQGRVALLIVTADAAGRRQELIEQAERLSGRCVVFGTKVSMGELLGRSPTAIIAISGGAIADEIRRAAEHAAELAEDA